MTQPKVQNPLDPNNEKPLKFKYIPLSDIKVSVRLREDLGDVKSLAESISQFGILQPLVIDKDFRLIAGGRRYFACTQLGIDKVPVVFKETVSKSHHHILELVENIYRKQMSWQEEVKGVYLVHKFNERNAVLGGKEWTQGQTARILQIPQGSISVILKLGGLLTKEPNHPAAKGEHPGEALQIITQERVKELEKESLKRSVGAGKRSDRKLKKSAKIVKEYTEEELDQDEELREINLDEVFDGPRSERTPTGLTEIQQSVDLSHICIHGDCIKVMNEEMEPASIDHILTDPPYGIDLENFLSYKEAGFGKAALQGVADTHQVEPNLQLLRDFWTAAYRVTKPHSWVITFACITNFDLCRKYALEAGFKVQDWPIIWHKPSASLNRMAGINFTKNYEVAVVARRENASLRKNGPKAVITLDGAKSSKGTLGLHPFIKPFSLWLELLSAIAGKNETILDPFAGVGSSVEAVLVSDNHPIAIELDEQHWLSLCHNVKVFYSELTYGRATFIGAPMEKPEILQTQG